MNDQPSDPSWAVGLKELTTVLIGAVTVGVTLWMLWQAFDHANQAGAAERREVLTIAVGLAGTATGYFFGRVPAEARARTAEHHADRMHDTADKQVGMMNRMAGERDEAIAKVRDAVQTLAGVRERMRPATGRRRSIVRVLATDELTVLDRQLADLEDRLRS
jgi:hypothetical protein